MSLEEAHALNKALAGGKKVARGRCVFTVSPKPEMVGMGMTVRKLKWLVFRDTRLIAAYRTEKAALKQVNRGVFDLA